MLRIGRITLNDPTSLSESAGEGRDLQASGEETEALTADSALRRKQQILGLQGRIVPLVWPEDPLVDGFYEVTSASADLVALADGAFVNWQLSLSRVGGSGEVDFDSRMTRTQLINAHGRPQQQWHSPPAESDSYDLGIVSATPALLTRQGEHGAQPVYVEVGSSHPQWAVDPGGFLSGAAELTVDGWTVTGLNAPDTPHSWQISNGLVRASWAGDRLRVSSWSGGAWRPKDWMVHAGFPVGSWDRLTVPQNDPECVVVRLVRGLNPGRVQLDLTLRRGSRFVAGFLQRTGAASLQVFRASTEPPEPLVGVVRAGVDDADGNRACIGSTRAFNSHSTTVGVVRNNVSDLDVFIGVEVGGTAASVNDRAGNLLRQHIGYAAEQVRAVTR